MIKNVSNLFFRCTTHYYNNNLLKFPEFVFNNEIISGFKVSDGRGSVLCTFCDYFIIELV